MSNFIAKVLMQKFLISVGPITSECPHQYVLFLDTIFHLHECGMSLGALCSLKYILCTGSVSSVTPANRLFRGR